MGEKRKYLCTEGPHAWFAEEYDNLPCPGCFADLHRQLREAQAKAKEHEDCPDLDMNGECPLVNEAISEKEEVQDDLAEGRRIMKTAPRRTHKLKQDLDAATKRGVRAIHYLCGTSGALREIVDTLLAEAEAKRDAAIERGAVFCRYASAVEVTLWHWVDRFEAAEADAAEQRALVEELAQAVVGIGYDREHQEGWRCKLCHAWWPLNTKPGHEDDCPLAPAEALRAKHRSPQSGQKGGDDA